jgi:Flp pilus assembly protein TadD
LVLERARRDPGGALLVIALAAVVALYAATLARGLVNYDDPWLIESNWIATHPSWASLHAIFCDLSTPTRFVLGAEYLPVRDVSVMLDASIWGTWYGGFHLTNVLIYGGAIVAWFAALQRFGIDRRVVGVAILIWALHPAHAESVAWLAERKGVLGALFSGLAALGYARFRGGGRAVWIVMAALCAVAAIWSKALSAFALASLAGLEVALPAQRASVRRAVVGLGVVAAAALAAFVPVVVVARGMAVVSTAPEGPAPGLVNALGLHGFYIRILMCAVRNAASYPIATAGPSGFDIAVGAVGLAGAIALVVRGRGELRAGAILWLVGFIPLSRLVMPVRGVVLADRYLLVPSLGVALVAAGALYRIAEPRARTALITVIVFAAALRTLDAQANWRDAMTLWQRATEVAPGDGDAWSMYADALDDAGEPQQASEAVMRGLHHTSSPRLVMREALLVMEQGDPAHGRALMHKAAELGEPRAMANVALLELRAGHFADAQTWARKSTQAAPLYANGQRIRGKVALAAGADAQSRGDLAGAAAANEEARAAFVQALALEPGNRANHLNLALALLQLGRRDEARPHLEACLPDPTLGDRARALLGAP